MSPQARRALPVLGSIQGDGKRPKIVPADVSGPFARARRVVFVLLMGLYLALPWLGWNGRPLVLFDVARRQAFLFGASFNAQDVWMLVFVLTGGAFALVVGTALFGRVWCGWGCPQTVWIEGLFRPLERLVHGSREKRLRREQHGPSWDLAWRKVLVQVVYVVLALALAHAFLAYFMPVRQIVAYAHGSPLAQPGTFVFAMVLATVLYVDFAWFREQFCVVLCPYGRLQSLLLDDDSLVVGYDVGRGEPRGKKGTAGAGDCVDCTRCVVVCPTGIDIRQGLQMDCVACTACIDACDEIMTRLDRPRGLIRYDSQSGLAGRPRRILRPRLALYATLALAGLAASTLAFGQRRGFESNLLRAGGAPYALDGDDVQNGFHVHLVNKLTTEATFTLQPTGVPGARFIVPLASVHLAPLADADVPFFVRVPRSSFVRGTRVTLSVTASNGETRATSAELLGPAP